MFVRFSSDVQHPCLTLVGSPWYLVLDFRRISIGTSLANIWVRIWSWMLFWCSLDALLGFLLDCLWVFIWCSSGLCCNEAFRSTSIQFSNFLSIPTSRCYWTPEAGALPAFFQYDTARRNNVGCMGTARIVAWAPPALLCRHTHLYTFTHIHRYMYTYIHV